MSRTKQITLSLLSLFLTYAFLLLGEPHADMSFLVIDFKYSEKRGVQICEMQPGLISMFRGYTELYQDNGLAERFWEIFGGYHDHFWYFPVDVVDPNIRAMINLNGGATYTKVNDLLASKEFNVLGQVRPVNPFSLFDYQGILIASYVKIPDRIKFHDEYPGILLLDEAFYPYNHSKAAMSSLFEGEEEFRALKPQWAVYKKGDSEKLATRILADFKAQHLVLKPLHAAKGYGVLIVERNDLKSTLKYIFGNSEKLRKDKNKSNNYWSRDTRDSFVVEEFVVSDPIQLSPENPKLYDPTGRVILMLTYHEKVPQLHILDMYWKLPPSHLGSNSSFENMHKSQSPGSQFAMINGETRVRIEDQLDSSLPFIYERSILSHD